MEQKLGYSLIDENNQEIKFWNQEPEPNPIILPNGDHVHAPALNTSYSGYQLVERWQISDETPGLVRTGQTISFDGTKILVTLEYRNPNETELLQHSASARYNKEISGVEINNNVIYTDRQSQAMITGIVSLMQLQPNTTIDFKTGNGFIEANNQTMLEIASAVAMHVQTCFGLEANVSQQIVSGAITTFAEIDNKY